MSILSCQTWPGSCCGSFPVGCWDGERLCAKASCLGESGAVRGVLRSAWGGRDDLAGVWQNCTSGETRIIQ